MGTVLRLATWNGDVLVAFRNLDFEDLDLHCYLRTRVVQLVLVQSLYNRCDGIAIRLRLFEYQLRCARGDSAVWVVGVQNCSMDARKGS